MPKTSRTDAACADPAHLEAEDCVSVKPHAPPVLHALSHLLGHLDQGH